MSKKEFATDCVSAIGEDINNMKDAARDITRRTFLGHVAKESRTIMERMLGYTHDFTMKNDWHVSYYKSVYCGKPCVYFVHSAIEYIFI